MNPNDIPKGQAAESNTLNQTHLAGVWRHESAGAEIITAPGNDGNVQADALYQLGYTRIGDAPSGSELHEMRQAQAAIDKAAEEPTTKKESK